VEVEVLAEEQEVAVVVVVVAPDRNEVARI
jgi:hypothetical protein